VTKFWVKKYKAHSTYNQLQAIANEYESVAYAEPPTSSASSIANDDETYISILKEMLAYLTMEHELAFAVTNRAAKRTPSNTLATNRMNKFCQQLITEMRYEMAKVLAVAMTTAKAGTGNKGGGTGGGGTGRVGTGGNTKRSCGRRNGSNLPVCPHCKKMGSTSLTTASRYQQMRANSRQTSLMGSLCMRRRWNDKERGMVVIA
jgi:hypothetical protein